MTKGERERRDALRRFEITDEHRARLWRFALMRAQSVCAEVGCPNFVERGHGRCEACAKVWRQAHPRASRYNGTAWRKVRQAYLRAHPRCERCGKQATDVHHRDGDGPHGDNSDANLEALCKSCHSRHTAREQVPHERVLLRRR